MKVTVVCPNCNQEILVDGVKLVVDGGGTPKLGAIKSYVGWGDRNKGKLTGSTSSPPPTSPKDEGKELGELLDAAINKSKPTAPPPIDKELHNYLKEENKRDNQIPPPYNSTGTTNPNSVVFSQPSIVGPGAINLKPPEEHITKINKPIKLPDESDSYKTLRIDNTIQDARDIIKKEVASQQKPTDLNLSTSTIDAIGREIAKRIAEFKSKGTCLICNVNPGDKQNLICDQCLQGIVTKKVQEEHKVEELKRVVW